MYIIIMAKDVHHQGDERSRTNPGHGYPAWVETVSEVEYYDNLDKFEGRISELEGMTGYSSRKYGAYSANRITVTKTVKLDISRQNLDLS